MKEISDEDIDKLLKVLNEHSEELAKFGVPFPGDDDGEPYIALFIDAKVKPSSVPKEIGGFKILIED